MNNTENSNNLPKLVAVYGTLRMGNGNHRIMGDSTLVGITNTEKDWEMFSLGGFPGIRPGSESVVVEVYNVVDDGVAESLDCLEGFRDHGHPGNFYDKGTVNTPWGTAEVYVLDGEQYADSPLIESGDWNEYRTMQRG